MNNRFFGGRKLSAHIPTEKVRYEKSSTREGDGEKEARLKKYAAFIEGGEDGGEEEDMKE